MAVISRGSIIQALIKGLRLDAGKDKIPTETTDKVQPVFSIEEEKDIQIFADANTATGNKNLLTTPLTGRDFYLTGAYLMNNSTVAADNTTVILSATVNGVTSNFIAFRKTTLTAYNRAHEVFFCHPIKIDSNTNIVFTTAFTVGASETAGRITGYFKER